MAIPPDLEADIAYLVHNGERARHRIFPPSSGRGIERPPQAYTRMPVHDARRLDPPPGVDDAGFAIVAHRSAVTDFYADDEVRGEAYAEARALLQDCLGADAVMVFDHNQRSAARARAGQPGVRTPVDAAHNDYTPSSGPRRAREILEDAGRTDLLGARLALINVWRPIIGPAQDVPLAICDARSAAPADFVETDILHFGEDDLETPRHTGQIYSVRHNPEHRWYYVPDMQPDEVLLLKNWDSDPHRAAYTAHTGFRNPRAPDTTVPRESIELRTLVAWR